MRQRVALIVLLSLPVAIYAQSGSRGKFWPDDPLRVMPAPLPVTSAKIRKISEVYDLFLNMLVQPGEHQPKAGPPVPARGVNTLGEVPDTAWYVNRHYFRPMSVEELTRGPGSETPPADGSWTIVSAKSEGITPGFLIRDRNGELYLMKFDPVGSEEIATAADVISSKFFHALGYHVPENYIVYFDRSRLELGEETQLVDRLGHRRKMSDQDLSDILVKVPRDAEKKYRGVASRYLVGKPVGPRRYHGTRRDDPNDTVPHEHRRDLRGFRVFCAWLNHEDSRAINSLDMIVNEGGIPFIRHYLIDFGSTLGSASTGPNSPRSGFEEFFSWKSSAKEFFTLGLYVPRWARARYPNLPSVGRFEHEAFDPEKWTPEYYNAAFSSMLPDDAFWAARQVMALTDEQIRAIVKTGGFSDSRAEEWVTKCLIERRNKIGRAYLSKVLPLDRFTIQEGSLRFEDLAVNHGLLESFQKPPLKGSGVGRPKRQYSVQWAQFDNATGAHSRIPGDEFTIPSTNAAYVVATIKAEDAKKSVLVYLRRQTGSWDIVGIERTW